MILKGYKSGKSLVFISQIANKKNYTLMFLY